MLEFGGHPISVGVRVRPLIPPEKTEKESHPIIDVDDATTVSVSNPEDPRDIRVFGFSHVYWSCDGFVEIQDGLVLPDLKHPNGFKYCDNRRIFDNIGKEMVQNAWAGMNNTFLSFGDLASGKSWSLFGNLSNKGLIHLFSSELYKILRDKEKTNSSVSNASPIGSSISSEVRLSAGEIHENVIKDLLQPQSNGGTIKYKIAVKVREHPKRGFYMEGLKSLIVTSPEDVQLRLEEAQNTRAANDISRGLLSTPTVVIVSLSLLQKYRNPKGDEMTMSSVTEFYDFPIRRPQTLPTESSPEKSNSNSTNYKNYFNSYTPHKKFSNNEKLSRSTASSNSNPPLLPQSMRFDDHFANLVNALVNNSSIPFENFTLSKLLEKGLSGNSKTYCLAHCTPSQAKRQATLWTLALADKLQRLRTHPSPNEEVTSKLIRELKLENDSLKKMLTSGGVSEVEKNEGFAWSDKLALFTPSSEEFRRQMIDDIRSQVRDNEREIKGLSLSQDERAKLAKIDKPNDTSQSLKKLENEKRHKPFIYNLSGDAILNGRLVHFIPTGSTEFGSKDRVIRIFGPGTKEFHGTFQFSGKDNKVTVKPASQDCLIKVNGILIGSEAPLFHNDRILLGGSQFWIFQNPREPWLEKNPVMTKITLAQAQEELCIKSQFYNGLSENGIIAPSLKSSTTRIYSRVEDANAILNELEISASFEPALVQDINRVLLDSSSWNVSHSSGDFNTFESDTDSREVAVRLHLMKEDARFVLSEETFQRKYAELKKAYAQSLEDHASPPTEAIFSDISETPMTIGHSLFSLKPLAYLIKYEDNLEILDYLELQPVGSIKVSAAPCSEYFEELQDNQNFLSDSSDLISKQLYFTLKIGSVASLSSKYKDITCTYKFFSETSTSTGNLDTKQAFPSSSSAYKYERRFSIEHVTPQLIESLEKDLVVLTFYGKLRPKSGRNQFKATNYGSQNPSKKSPYLGWIQRQKAELLVAKKAGDRVKEKLGIMQNLISCSDEFSQSSIPLEYLKKVCNVKDQSMAIECIKEFKDEFAPPPEVEPLPKLSTYQKVSEVCSIM